MLSSVLLVLSSSLLLAGCESKDPANYTLENAINYSIEETRAIEESVTIADNLETEIADDKIVDLYLAGFTHDSVEEIGGSMLIQTQNIMEDMQCREDVSKLTFHWSFNLVDKYQNTTKETVMEITYEKETLAGLDFETFLWEDIPTTANEYYIHPFMTGE